LATYCSRLSENPPPPMRVGYDFTTPPCITQKTPFPAQAMHVRTCKKSSMFLSDLLALLLCTVFPSFLGVLLRTAPRGGWGPAPPFNMCFVYQDRGPSPFIPNGRAHSSYALSSLAEDETEIKSGWRQSVLMRSHGPE